MTLAQRAAYRGLRLRVEIDLLRQRQLGADIDACAALASVRHRSVRSRALSVRLAHDQRALDRAQLAYVPAIYS